jgi:hypothetical protein
MMRSAGSVVGAILVSLPPFCITPLPSLGAGA